MAAHSYHELVDIANTKKLREQMQDLPAFVFHFFRGIEPTTSSRTRIAYAYDLHVFFDYLSARHPYFIGKDIKSLQVTDLDQVKPIDLEQYMEYLRYYHSENGSRPERVNQERGIMRKISSLKTFYNYFFRKEAITTNGEGCRVCVFLI